MPEKEDDLEVVCATDVSVLADLFFASIGIVMGLVVLIFVEITKVHLDIALAIICTCVWMLGMIELMKNGVDYAHKKYNTGEMKRCRNQLLIGLGGITICGIIPRIVLFLVSNFYILYYCFITCFVTSAIFYYYFIIEFHQKWQLKYEKKHIPLVFIVLAIQIIVLVVSMKIATIYPNKTAWRSDLIDLGYYQFCTMALFATSIIDIGVVLAGGLDKKKDVELETVHVVQPSAPVDPIVEVDSPRLDCKICMVEYSEAVIPRILKECGHTICEKCADQMLDKNNGQHLFCPFCQTVTLVKGPASHLPKNFTITNMIDEKKRP